MSALFRIVYAAHANGTHHKLALDALNHMERSDAEAWRKVFLQHVGLYLEGSKAPDNSFKDFKNHVLHVGDAYWGGAPEKVEAWYGHTVTALRAEKWADAAYAAGVLSHYYTDPVHPFHTGQTEAENSMHRACEWSINRSYNDLRALGEKKFAHLQVASHKDAHWLKQMTCDGAEFSHRYYEKLIAHYDLKRGVVRPEEGLDDVAKTIVAELLMYAADGFGHILDRAIAEAGVAAPEVSLTLETFIATLKIPAKWIEKKLSNAEDRRIVQAMYDELQTTGKVEHTLPDDDRVIRDLHKREVLDRAKELQLDKRAVRHSRWRPGGRAPRHAPEQGSARTHYSHAHPLARREARNRCRRLCKSSRRQLPRKKRANFPPSFLTPHRRAWLRNPHPLRHRNLRRDVKNPSSTRHRCAKQQRNLFLSSHARRAPRQITCAASI